jgi:allantoate deiminase
MAISLDRIKRNLEDLSRYTSTPEKGTTRLPFSPEARAAVIYLSKEMSAAGMRVREDAAGNIIGRIEGKMSDAPALLIASHYDSVTNGGDFDGIAGIIAGIELVRHFQEEGIELNHPVEVMGTNDEEGMRFGTGFFGINAMAGEIDAGNMRSMKDKDGVSIYDAMKEYGLDPEQIALASRDVGKEIEAFIEIHVEQGPVLYNTGFEIGLVEGIVGLKRFMVTVNGQPDHAGTTPMDMRIDAMDCAAKVISKISDWAVEAGRNTVATVGSLEVFPNAINIVAEKVIFSVDLRSIDEASITQVCERIKDKLKKICSEKRASFFVEETLNVSPVHLDKTILTQFENSCRELGYSSLKMLSGAGHDALPMASKLSTAMLFVPSRKGRSHCQEEWSEYGDFVKAIEVLSDTMIRHNY